MNIPSELLRLILVMNYNQQKTLRLVCNQWWKIADGDDFLCDIPSVIFWELSSNVLHKWWDHISPGSIRLALSSIRIDHKVLIEHCKKPIIAGSKEIIAKYQRWCSADSVEDIRYVVRVASGDQIAKFCEQYYDQMRPPHWYLVSHIEQIAYYFPDRFNFSYMSLGDYPVAFLMKFKNRIDWENAFYPTAEQMDLFRDVINWRNVHTRSVPILERYRNKIDWKTMGLRQNLSLELLVKFADELRPYLG